MLSLQLSEFVVELKEGSIKNVGPPNKTATAKLYDVVDAEAREFGDERVKIAVEDEEGNVVQVALDPEAASQVARDIEALEADSRVFDEE
jgi:type II secretory pathway component PulM